MATALVTGGAGFIGSHLVERLLAEGETVLVLDDLSTGSMGNLAGVEDRPELEVHRGSVADEALVAHLAERAETVYHLAAAVGVRLIVQDPVGTIRTNVYGTDCVLRHCAGAGTKVLIASSSEVYGKGQARAFGEDDDLVFGPTTHQRWSYGCSKAIDEFLGLAYRASRGLPVVIMRLFNIVGPRQTGRYGMVVPRFVEQALAGEPITVYGDGQQVRCFTHVLDAVEAIRALARCEAAVGQVVNVGSDAPVAIGELAERVRQVVNPAAPIDHVPYAEAYGEGFEDIRYRVPDATRLRGLTGWEPTRDLDNILRDVRDYVASSSPGGSG